jgi:hypothetical protein
VYGYHFNMLCMFMVITLTCCVCLWLSLKQVVCVYGYHLNHLKVSVLLGYDVGSLGKRRPTFRRNLVSLLKGYDVLDVLSF